MNTTLLEKAHASQSVMIVEDESIISLDIKSSLINLGYSVAGVAASGNAALTKISNTNPDLILMDIQLKGEMTGIDIAETVRSDFQIPVIYLTANADSATFQQAKSTSPYSYLLKPFGEKELGIAIELALHKHQQEQIVSASEKWYATAFQSLSESVVATDAAGNIVFLNAFAETMTGLQLSKVIDQPLVEVLTFEPAAEPWRTAGNFESVASILETVLTGRSTVQPLPEKIQLLTQSSGHVAIEGDVSALRETSGRIIGSIFKFKEYRAPAHKRVLQSFSTATGEQANATVPTADEPAKYSEKDIELVNAFTQAFIKKESTFLSTPNLVASSGEGVTTLSARSEGLVVKVTAIDDTLTAAVQQSSEYWTLVRQVLIERHFFPVSVRTGGFCRFQHLEVPEDCQVYHTQGEAFCEAWYGNPHYVHPGGVQTGGVQTGGAKHTRSLRESLVVLRRDEWYHVQKLVMKPEGLNIKTIAGELFVPPGDSLVWGVMD
ncbi:MAG: response regulator [Cyanobacteria bacterium J06598_1]